MDIKKSKISSWPSFSRLEANSAKEVILSNKVNYWTGNEARLFEKEFAKFAGTKYAVALTNGTVAIDLALIALNIGSGDEVIVTSRTFLASVSSIINSGARPIFCDVSRDSQNMDVTKIKDLITKNTKAILCVHLSGWPCDMDEIKKISKEHKLYIIEDCAQAHGAKYKGLSVGSIGHIGCWSFCQDKIMTTGGEGGMVTTNSKKLWNKMWSYKDHGKSYTAVYSKKHPPGFKWLHESFGTNWRMLEIQAKIGRIQLENISEWTKKRNINQNIIWKTASKLNGLRVPQFKCLSCKSCTVESGCIHAAYKCYVFVDKEKLKIGWNRDKIIKSINDLGIPCFSGSCSEVYLEKAFKGKDFRPKKRLKVARELGQTALMFLIHPTLKRNEIKLICSALESVMVKAAKQ